MESFGYSDGKSGRLKSDDPSVSGGGGASSMLESCIKNYVPKTDVKAFKIAFFNTALLVFVAICFAGIFAVYKLFFAFLKPMMWAVLVGTVIFPLKRTVTDIIRGWLRNLRDTGTPLALGFLMLPLSWLDFIAEGVWRTVTSQSIFYIIGGYLGMKLLTYEQAFIALLRILTKCYELLNVVIWIFSCGWVIPIGIIYTAGFLVWAKVHVSAEGSNGNKRLAHILCSPIWFWLLCLGASFFGVLRVPVFIGSSILLGLLAAGAVPGFVSKKKDSNATEEEQVQETMVDKVAKELTTQSEEDEPQEPGLSNGDMYLRGILGACVLLFTVRHAWLLLIFAGPLMYAIMKKTGQKLGVLPTLKQKVCDLWTTFAEKFRPVVDLAIPSTLRNFFRILFTGDQKIIVGLENSMDLLSSVVVMVLFLIGAIFLGVFIIVQIQAETVHLMRVGGNLLDSEEGMPQWMTGAVNFTGSKLSEHDIDGYLDDAYTYGRTWLAEQVRRLADPADIERADMLEAQIKQLVDKVYEIWRSEPSLNLSTKDVHMDIWDHLQNGLDVTKITEEVTLIVQENIGTLMAVAESVWGVLASNLGFIMSILGAMLGIILGFGLELLNLIIGVVVFLTMLYYLLACSGDQWKPLELLGSFRVAQSSSSTDHRTGFSDAVEQAIRGVFELSFKMSVFYWAYTWFIHTLFDLNVVFVPSMLAALFAAIPLTSPFTVCIPGALELWLVRGESAAGILFMIAAVAPLCFADTAFYHEVKTSHPYVTGLAIVGGIYWLGLEGAIIGPILLCCILVLFNMVKSQ